MKIDALMAGQLPQLANMEGKDLTDTTAGSMSWALVDAEIDTLPVGALVYLPHDETIRQRHNSGLFYLVWPIMKPTQATKKAIRATDNAMIGAYLLHPLPETEMSFQVRDALVTLTSIIYAMDDDVPYVPQSKTDAEAVNEMAVGLGHLVSAMSADSPEPTDYATPEEVTKGILAGIAGLASYEEKALAILEKIRTILGADDAEIEGVDGGLSETEANEQQEDRDLRLLQRTSEARVQDPGVLCVEG